jgi:hypothetical protein
MRRSASIGSPARYAGENSRCEVIDGDLEPNASWPARSPSQGLGCWIAAPTELRLTLFGDEVLEPLLLCQPGYPVNEFLDTGVASGLHCLLALPSGH